MALKFDKILGKIRENDSSPAGSDTQIQFNSNGGFGADSNLVWDNVNKRLGIGGTPATSFHLFGKTSAHNATIDTGINFTIVNAPASAPTIALINQAGNVNAGTHYYAIAYGTDRGWTNLSARSSLVTDASNGQVQVTLPVSSDYRVTKRRIYRTKANGAYYNIYLLAEISDNTTTSYTDNLADSTLGTLNAYFQTNTTNDLIRLNGARAMFIDGSNSWFGVDAGARTTSGGSNTLFGTNAGYGITAGDRIVAVGQAALSNGTVTSEGHVAIGYASLSNTTSGAYNVAVGYQSGVNQTSGFNNTFIGFNSGFAGQAVSNNMFFGALSGRYETAGNKLIIDSLDRGNEANSRAQALIYGVVNATPANQILSLGGGGKVGIGTTTPSSVLDVVGLPIYANNAAAITGGLTAGAFYRTNSDPDYVCVVH